MNNDDKNDLEIRKFFKIIKIKKKIKIKGKKNKIFRMAKMSKSKLYIKFKSIINYCSTKC